MTPVLFKCILGINYWERPKLSLAPHGTTLKFKKEWIFQTRLESLLIYLSKSSIDLMMNMQLVTSRCVLYKSNMKKKTYNTATHTLGITYCVAEKH